MYKRQSKRCLTLICRGTGRRGPGVLIKTLRNSSRNIWNRFSYVIDIFCREIRAPRYAVATTTTTAPRHSAPSLPPVKYAPCRSSFRLERLGSEPFTSRATESAPLLLSTRVTQPPCREFQFPFRLPSTNGQGAVEKKEKKKDRLMNREQRIRGLNFPWKIFAIERRNEANRARSRKKGSGEERKCSTTLPL